MERHLIKRYVWRSSAIPTKKKKLSIQSNRNGNGLSTEIAWMPKWSRTLYTHIAYKESIKFLPVSRLIFSQQKTFSTQIHTHTHILSQIYLSIWILCSLTLLSIRHKDTLPAIYGERLIWLHANWLLILFWRRKLCLCVCISIFSTLFAIYPPLPVINFYFDSPLWRNRLSQLISSKCEPWQMFYFHSSNKRFKVIHTFHIRNSFSSVFHGNVSGVVDVITLPSLDRLGVCSFDEHSVDDINAKLQKGTESVNDETI